VGVDAVAAVALKDATPLVQGGIMQRASLRFAVGAALVFAAPAWAVTEDAFQLRTGADLVALCSTPPEDRLHAAAVHMCHGYGAGVFQAVMALTSHEKLPRVICPPNPRPSRNEAVARFLEWAKAHPQHHSEPAVEFVGRFLTAEYPCPKTTGKGAS
jgi:hypothetical protein